MKSKIKVCSYQGSGVSLLKLFHRTPADIERNNFLEVNIDRIIEKDCFYFPHECNARPFCNHTSQEDIAS